MYIWCPEINNCTYSRAVGVGEAWKALASLFAHMGSLLCQVSKLVMLLLVIPARNARRKRPFGAVQRIKTYLHSMITQHELNNLMVLFHGSHTAWPCCGCQWLHWWQWSHSSSGLIGSFSLRYTCTQQFSHSPCKLILWLRFFSNENLKIFRGSILSRLP